MSPSPLPIGDILNSGLLIGLKYLYLFAFLTYLLFTLIVVRQIKLMSQTILGPSEKWIKITSYIYLIFSFICFILAIIIL